MAWLGDCEDAWKAFLDCVAAAAKDGTLLMEDGTPTQPLPCLDAKYSFRNCMMEKEAYAKVQKLAEMELLRRGCEVCKECKDEFVVLEECVVAAQKDGDDTVERCHEATANLKKCIEAVNERA